MFPAKWLTHPLPHADPDLRRILEQEVAWLDAHYGTDFKAKVQRVLRTLLATGKCSSDQAAQLFAMHRRTLTRRLQAEGATFEALLDEVRYTAARQLLRDTDLPLSQIAAIVAYADVTAFTRAFRRWSGKTPALWRSMCHAVEEGPS